MKKSKTTSYNHHSNNSKNSSRSSAFFDEYDLLRLELATTTTTTDSTEMLVQPQAQAQHHSKRHQSKRLPTKNCQQLGSGQAEMSNEEESNNSLLDELTESSLLFPSLAHMPKSVDKSLDEALQHIDRLKEDMSHLCKDIDTLYQNKVENINNDVDHDDDHCLFSPRDTLTHVGDVKCTCAYSTLPNANKLDADVALASRVSSKSVRLRHPHRHRPLARGKSSASFSYCTLAARSSHHRWPSFC